MALALIIAVLLGGGTFMVLRRGMLRIVVGFLLISHGVNLLLLLSGGPSRRSPALGHALDPAEVASALPQALVLTAVVISFAVTVFMLGLSVIGDGDDDTDLDLTDREWEMPELLEEDSAARLRRLYPASNWHSYLDHSDDTDDGPMTREPVDGITVGEAGDDVPHTDNGPRQGGDR